MTKMMYGGAMTTCSQNKQQQLEQAKDIVINSIGETYPMDQKCKEVYGPCVFIPA